MSTTAKVLNNADCPAHPVVDLPEYFHGMTKREEMVMHILPALLQAYDASAVACNGTQVVRDAIWYADQVLSQLEETKE